MPQLSNEQIRGILDPISPLGLLDAPGAQMSAYEPSIRDRIGYLLYDQAIAAGFPEIANRLRNEGTLAADVLPGLGETMGAEDTSRALEAGNYGQAALNAGTTALGAIPGGGDVAAGLVKAIFGGVGAKTADRAALMKAQELAQTGAPREDIWRETGWFQGPDERWRFEIDDSTAHIKGVGSMGEITGRRGGSLNDVFFHRGLGAAYPEIGEIAVRGLDTPQAGMKGYYKPGDMLDPDISPELAISNSLGGQDQRSTMLHELQHAVQMREGFARGAHPDEYASGAMFHERARGLQGELSKALTGGLTASPREILQNVKYADPAEISEIAAKHGFRSVDEALAFLKQQDEMRTPMSQYKRTAGEVEARNVQSRMNMTPDQRRATPPWETMDVPLEQQIVRTK